MKHEVFLCTFSIQGEMIKLDHMYAILQFFFNLSNIEQKFSSSRVKKGLYLCNIVKYINVTVKVILVHKNCMSTCGEISQLFPPMVIHIWLNDTL